MLWYNVVTMSETDVVANLRLGIHRISKYLNIREQLKLVECNKDEPLLFVAFLYSVSVTTTHL